VRPRIRRLVSDFNALGAKICNFSGRPGVGRRRAGKGERRRSGQDAFDVRRAERKRSRLKPVIAVERRDDFQIGREGPDEAALELQVGMRERL
jgi:hypothetical protein